MAAVESYLVSHKKVLHEIVSDKCEKCDFEANIRADMMAHTVMVHGDEPSWRKNDVILDENG